MSIDSSKCSCSESASRRHFLGSSLGLAATAVVGTSAISEVAFAGSLSKAQRDKMTPDQVLALMKKGNKRFAMGRRQDHNYLRQQRESAKGQYPAAVLLSCIDSRAPAETIMDLRIGDIFNSRVAGNISMPTSWAAWNSPARSPARRSCWSWATRRAAPSRARSTMPSSAT